MPELAAPAGGFQGQRLRARGRRRAIDKYVELQSLRDGVTLDEVKYHREVVATERDLTIAAGVIEAGTIAAMKMCLDGG